MSAILPLARVAFAVVASLSPCVAQAAPAPFDITMHAVESASPEAPSLPSAALPSLDAPGASTLPRLRFVGGSFAPPPGERIGAAFSARLERDGTAWGYLLCTRAPSAADFSRWHANFLRLDRQHGGDPRVLVVQVSRPAWRALRVDPLLHWVGDAPAMLKLDPKLRERAASPDARQLRLWVSVFGSEPARGAEPSPLRAAPMVGPLRAAGLPASRLDPRSRALRVETDVRWPRDACTRRLEALGAAIEGYASSTRVYRLRLASAGLAALLREPCVRFVEPVLAPSVDGDRATRQIGADALRNVPAVDGADVVLGVLDTGVDLGHNDLNKFAAGFTFVPGGDPFQDRVGHGTHVLGAIAGEGRADPRYRGIAAACGSDPMRRIFIGQIVGTGDPLESRVLSAVTRFGTALASGQRAPDLVQAAFGIGSVQSAGYVGSDALSRAIDEQVWKLGQSWVVSAGNDGGSAFHAELTHSMRPPAVAKNVLTVGSVTDHRGADSGGSFETGRVHWSSGKGPTKDARIKPDLTAPGHELRAPKAGTTSGFEDRAGTSMASALVSGVLTGVLDHYPVLRGKPAVQKALLCAVADPWRGTRAQSSTSESWWMRQGFGCVDAYRANFQRPSDPQGFAVGLGFGSLANAQSGAQIEVRVPTDAKRLFVALNMVEPASSPGAMAACMADLDLYLDVEPFSSGFASGEYSSKLRGDCWDRFESDAMSLAALRGKRVRIKVHAATPPAPGKDAQWGLAYQIHRGADPQSNVRVIAPDVVRLGRDFNVAAILQVPSLSQSHVEMALRVDAAKLPIQDLGVFFGDMSLITYRNPLDARTDRLDSWTVGASRWWEPFWRNRLLWTVRAQLEGSHSYDVEIFSDDRSPRQERFAQRICVDGKEPQDIQALRSPTHTVQQWSRDPNVQLQWDPMQDVGCADIAGIALVRSEGAPAVPSALTDRGKITTLTQRVDSTKSGYFFSARAVDRVFLLSKQTLSIGPILVDVDLPEITLLEVAGGAKATASATNGVRLVATDAHSGLADMRFSGDKTTWTPWQTYASTAQSIDFGVLGWTGPGPQKVYCELRDVAGNVASAEIAIDYFLAPLVSSSAPMQLDTVGQLPFVLTGSRFTGVDRIDFGAVQIDKTQAVSWADGYFVIKSDSTLELYAPQGLAPGSYDVVLHNPATASAKLPLQLVAPATPTLGVAPERPLGQPFRILCHHGSAKSSSLTLLTLSSSMLPVRIAGVIDLEHGGASQAVLDPSFFVISVAVLHDPGTGVAQWTLPAAVRAKLYFEAILIDPTASMQLPFTTSNAGVCTIVDAPR